MQTSLSAGDKLNLISNLDTMLTAGIPILEAVDSLLEEAKNNQRKILLQLKEDLNQGKNIADSLSKFPNAFDPVTVNIIRAAEQSGTLESSLKDLTDNIKKDIDLSSKVTGAITYPIFVVVVFVGVLLLILTFVIPRIASVFGRFRVNLPLPTKILIFTSNIFINYFPLVLLVFVVLTVCLIVLYKNKKKMLLNVLFKLPLLSTLARQIDLTRFSRSMSLLLTSGIPITESLRLSAAVVTKKEVAQSIKYAQDSVTAGKKLSEGFKLSKGIIPSTFIRITEAGERSGTLDKSMQNISQQYETSVSNTLKTLTTLLEPLMLVVIGVLVGGIMLAVIAPIYGLIGNISAR